MQQQLVLCIDIGSSSVRCSLYKLPNDNDNGGSGKDGSSSSIPIVSDATTTGTTTTTTLCCSSSRSWEAVHASTGKIRLQQDEESISLFDVLEECMDDLFQKINNTITSSDDDDDDDVVIVAVGFSSLVMNLIGVDAQGHPVGQEATLSYACNLPQVAQEVQELERYVRNHRTHLVVLVGCGVWCAFNSEYTHCEQYRAPTNISFYFVLYVVCFCPWHPFPTLPLHFHRDCYFTLVYWARKNYMICIKRRALPCMRLTRCHNYESFTKNMPN